MLLPAIQNGWVFAIQNEKCSPRPDALSSLSVNPRSGCPSNRCLPFLSLAWLSDGKKKRVSCQGPIYIWEESASCHKKGQNSILKSPWFSDFKKTLWIIQSSSSKNLINLNLFSNTHSFSSPSFAPIAIAKTCQYTAIEIIH